MNPGEMKAFGEEDAIGWLYVPLAKLANKFDDYSESMIDGIMCTPTCPCYGDESQRSHLNPRGTPKEDGFTRYAALDKAQPKYLGLWDRALTKAQVGRGTGSEVIPFTWSTDRANSYESFNECYEDWANKAKNDPTI